MRILITGGSSDIARAIAKHRNQMGDEIIFTASSEKSLEKTLEQYREENIQAEGIVYNFSQPEEGLQKLRDVLEKGVDALILNAWGRGPATRRLHEIPIDKIESYLNTNLIGNIQLIQQVLPVMMEKQFGRIVFISSVSVENGTGRYANYITGKSGLEGLMRNLAMDYGEFNILCNTVRLGIFKTSRTKKYWKRESYVSKMSGIIPQGKLGEPDEVAHALDGFLSSKQYMNGVTLNISGGLPMFKFEGVLKP